MTQNISNKRKKFSYYFQWKHFLLYNIAKKSSSLEKFYFFEMFYFYKWSSRIFLLFINYTSNTGKTHKKLFRNFIKIVNLRKWRIQRKKILFHIQLIKFHIKWILLKILNTNPLYVFSMYFLRTNFSPKYILYVFACLWHVVLYW